MAQEVPEWCSGITLDPLSSSSCRFIQRCANALEAEAAALMEGVDFALAQSSENLIVESDCAMLVRMFKEPEVNKS